MYIAPYAAFLGQRVLIDTMASRRLTAAEVAEIVQDFCKAKPVFTAKHAKLPCTQGNALRITIQRITRPKRRSQEETTQKISWE